MTKRRRSASLDRYQLRVALHAAAAEHAARIRQLPVWLCPACGDTRRDEVQRSCPCGNPMEIAWQPGGGPA